MSQYGLQDKKILVGVCGGIAAYKIVDLVRRLRKENARVRVVMTPAAMEFISPTTFQAVSEQPVATSLFDVDGRGMAHIDLARWADLVVVAPATADFAGKMAHGLADDLLSTLVLAAESPVALAPAMNRVMWQHPAVYGNFKTLEQRGTAVWGPAAGDQACGEVGEGRMLEPEQLLTLCDAMFAPDWFKGKQVLITAGPTQEALDPVRFIGNRSSGKMGFAMATAARAMGAQVTLVSGPVMLETPIGVQRVDVRSARSMFEAVTERTDSADIFIATAAVADYRPVVEEKSKIKKNKASMTMELERTDDILKAVSESGRVPFVVGFAAETENLDAYAKQKLDEKGCDLIVANKVGGVDFGFESDQNAVTLYWKGGQMTFPQASKIHLARMIMEFIGERYYAKNSS